MFLIPRRVSVSKLDLLGFWSMIDFLFELGVGGVYSRLQIFLIKNISKGEVMVTY